MVDGYYKAVCELQRDAGYIRVDGGKGSHEKWQNAETGHKTLVPRNLHSRHTANGILRDAGIRRKL